MSGIIIKGILDIRIYNNSLLKALFITNENKIIMLETLIDIHSFSIELFSENKYDIKNAPTQEITTSYTKTEKNGKIELKMIEDKNNILFSITDVTNQILDKFTEESEEI